MKKFIAFTLAEVLIVMGIIGVVAEMTVPTLMNQTQKVQGLSGLKKAYTNFNQTLNRMASDLGCNGDLSCVFDTTDPDTLGPKITAYFNVAKTCTTSQRGCFPDIVAFNYDGTSRLSGWDRYGYRFITKDGMSYSLDADSALTANCSLQNICMDVFMVDINGLKSPNILGRDVFQFYIMNPKGLYDWNYFVMNEKTGCSSANKEGTHCAARIMNEGWQMNY